MSAKNNVDDRFPSRVAGKIVTLFLLLSWALGILFPQPVVAAEDDWSRVDEEMVLEQRAQAVNEGELQLLDKPPAAAAHYHHNRMMITEQSLRDGWVTMYQCHSDLDKVHASQIVYDADHIRDIEIQSYENIGSARVERNTVQMTDIEAESEICISADKRVLSYENGSYYLRLGPFMRRFLDGYYPMHVRLEVCYPDIIELRKTKPVNAITHWDTAKQRFHADIDVWVVGKLEIELMFRDKKAVNQ
jgi:hypothetical protein